MHAVHFRSYTPRSSRAAQGIPPIIRKHIFPMVLAGPWPDPFALRPPLVALFTLPKMAWYYLKITHDKLKMYIVNPSTGFGKSNRPNPAHCLFLQIKLLEQSCPFVYILPMAAFAPQCRVCSWNRDLMAQSLKYLLSSSLQKRFSNPW